jgi:dihydrofolate reductase
VGSLTLWMQVSFDGYAAGPDGAFDWPAVGPDLQSMFVDELREAAAFVYGRRVFEGMAGYWPQAAEAGEPGSLDRAYGQIWVPMRKYVLSRTLEDPGWNSTVVQADELAAVKAATDGPLYLFGGPTAANELVRAGLVDEYRVFVRPVVLGGGARLLPELESRIGLDLVGARTYDGNVVDMHYRAR